MATSSQDVDFFASSPPPADRVRSESPKGPSLFRGGSEDDDLEAEPEVVSVQKKRKLDNGSAEGGASVAESSARKQEKSKSPSQQPEAGPSWQRKYVSTSMYALTQHRADASPLPDRPLLRRRMGAVQGERLRRGRGKGDDQARYSSSQAANGRDASQEAAAKEADEAQLWWRRGQSRIILDVKRQGQAE